ncbi:T9SS type A sorting domain-containing protein [bacterium]|nr:T9SS type A sorting domain-containing protein [bacterium]
MKRLLPLLLASLLLAISAGNLSAQILWEPEDGVPIRGMYEPLPELLLSGHQPGQGLLVWTDPRSGDYDFYGQLLEADGNKLWEEDGRPLITAPGAQFQCTGTTTSDGWVLAWLDSRGDGNDYREGSPYLQRFDGDGYPLWQEPGGDPYDALPLLPGDPTAGKIAVLPVDDGLFVAAAVDEDPDYPHLWDVRLFRLLLADGSCDPTWPADGVSLRSSPSSGYSSGDSLSVLPADDGDVIVVWQNQDTAFMQRVTAEGDILWSPPATVNAINFCYCSDGEGGVYFASTRRYNWYNQSLNLGHVLPTGWRVNGYYGEVLIPVDGPSHIPLALVESDPGSAILIAYRSTNLDGFLRAHKLGLVDTVQTFWSEPVLLHQGHFRDFIGAASDGQGGASVAVRDQWSLRTFHVNSEGSNTPGDIDLPFSINDQLILGPTDEHVSCVALLEEGPYVSLQYNLLDIATQSRVFPPEGVNAFQAINGWIRPTHSFDMTHAAGTVAFAWDDNRFGDSNCRLPYMQILDDESGTPLFEPGGVPVYPDLPDTSDYPVSFQCTLTPSHEGGFYFANALIFEQDGSRETVVQKFDPDGSPLWDPAGVDIWGTATFHGTIEPRVMECFGEDGVFITGNFKNYTENFSGTFVAHLSPDGDPLWSEGDGDYVVLAAQGAWPYGLAKLLPEDRILIPYRAADSMFVTALSSSGETVWSQQLSMPDNEPQTRIVSVATNARVIVIWVSASHELYAQAVDADGTLIWGNEPLLLEDDFISPYEGLTASIYSPQDDSFWISWNYAGQGFADKFTVETGSSVFQHPLSWDADEIRIAMTENGGAYITLGIDLPDLGYVMQCFTISEYGEPGDETITFNELNELWRIEEDGAGGLLLGWWDDKLDIPYYGRDHLRAQRLFLPPVSVSETSRNPVARQFSLAPVFPNPFNASAMVTVTLPAPGDLNVSLFNVLGQEVITLAHGPHAPGTHTLTVDGSTLASGIYFVHAEIVDGTQAAGKPSVATRKLVVLK